MASLRPGLQSLVVLAKGRERRAGNPERFEKMSEMRAPTVVIEPRRGLFDLDLEAVWEYRELLYFLVWRDVKVRYKQTAIGAAWVILQPLLTMMVFTVVFGYLARVPSDGLPYPIFTYTALLP